MRLAGREIMRALQDKRSFSAGRHLYGVLGSYAALERFENGDLAHLRQSEPDEWPLALNLNRALLDSIPDDELRGLIRDEARYPQNVRGQLNRALQSVLRQCLESSPFLILKQVELIFAYGLDLTLLRTMATNQYHILLLLPGERRGSQITLFQDAEPRFRHTFSQTLIADNHLWELPNG